jgi:hypothetical protein
MQLSLSAERPSFNFTYSVKDMKMDKKQLLHLVDMGSPENILAEIQATLQLINPEFDLTTVTAAFQTTLDLYQGNYPGYQACTTYYHDLHHSLSTSLAMVRLMHGAILEGQPFSERQLILAAVCAMFHDAGLFRRRAIRKAPGLNILLIMSPAAWTFYPVMAYSMD